VLPPVLGKTLNCPGNKYGGIVMEWTMILVFSGLSIFSGILVGLGTRSIMRGIVVSLLFLGFAMTLFLIELGVHEILSFFLGQVIVVGLTYIYLRVVHPEILTKAKKEFTYAGPYPGR
jgi:hypothetical protein